MSGAKMWGRLLGVPSGSGGLAIRLPAVFGRLRTSDKRLLRWRFVEAGEAMAPETFEERLVPRR